MPAAHKESKIQNPKSKIWDAVVVGAGVVGCYVARRLVEQKRKVLLLDARKRETLGGWKNSGHNIDKRVFERLPIRQPSDDEIGAQVDSAHYRFPTKSFDFYLPMYNVRLGPFTQRMLNDAIEAGVEFRDEVKCLGAIIENGSVVGVTAKSGRKAAPLRASLTIDVSGIDAVVRNSLPDEMGIEKGLTINDYLNVYSEDIEVGMENWPVPFVYHPIYQGWSGPRRPGVVGIGLGRFASTGEDPRVIHPELVRRALKVTGKTIYKTYQRVPVRRPLIKLVASGAIILGDAAYQGKPMNGEGLSVMLEAAEMAADVAGRAFYRKDFSEKSLWPYSRRWHRNIGARFAPLHRMRMEILKLSRADQIFLMALGVYGPREMSAIMLEGKIEVALRGIPRIALATLRGAFRPDLLTRLLRASLDGQKLKKLYRQYPDDPHELPGWVRQVEALYCVGS